MAFQIGRDSSLDHAGPGVPREMQWSNCAFLLLVSLLRQPSGLPLHPSRSNTDGTMYYGGHDSVCTVK